MRYLIRGIAVGFVLASFCGGLTANPTGPQVVHGQVSFAATDNQLNVTNSPNAIINWDQFSIGNGEITRFIQNSQNSNVLNRVTGSDPSAILGQLLSNGRVFLINPQGIIFGQNAVVDTAGLIASTLNISDADFINGRFAFESEPGVGNIVNEGIIRTSSGGEVFLLAPNVTNSGVIHTPDGRLVLAAGRKVVLTSFDLDGIRVEVQAPSDTVLNLGELIAERGAAEVFAGSIRNAGVIEANGVAIDEQGNVQLVATGDIELASGSSVTANGASGGTVVVQSETGTTWVKGTVSATGSEGRGGVVQLLGENVGLVENASVDASGETGGGEVLIGGDYKGGGTVQTAQGTFVAETAQIRADALGIGDGGRVIVWADGATRSYGRISARGGNVSGDGGFVETSGARYLDVGSTPPDVGANNGKGGSWLLDPFNVTIQAGTGTLDNLSPNFTSNANDSTIDVAVINAALDANNFVTVDTNGGGAQAGDLTVAAPILKSTVGLSGLTLDADGDININATITATSGDIDLTIDSQTQASFNQNVDIGAGSLTIENGASTVSAGVTIDADLLTVGNSPGLTASMIIDNATVNLTDAANIAIGGTGSVGTLTVQNGSTLQAGNFSVIGENDGSIGTMIVTGAGTVVDYNGADLVVASSGGGAGLVQGNLDILNGATVTGLTSIRVGNSFGGTATHVGNVLVDNATLDVTEPNGFTFIGIGNIFNDGGPGNGTFVAQNGAQVRTTNFLVGTDSGQSAIATITGVGTSLITAGQDNLVRAGAGNFSNVGTINITGGALVETLSLDSRAQGVLNISGAGTTVNVTNDTGGQPGNFVPPDVIEGGFMRAGREAGDDATLNITAGAVVNVLTGPDETGPGLQIARNAGSAGTVVVDNATVNIIQTTPLLEYGPFITLRGGDAELTVRNGGVINLAGEEAGLIVGRDATGDGLVRITGPGSQINVSGFDSGITIGSDGLGEMIVENGGTLNGVFINVGRNAGSTGLLTVTGTNSRINQSGGGLDFDGNPNGAFLTIGRAGTGTVDVNNGGQILITGANNPFPGFQLGREVGGEGTLLLTDAGSRIEITSNLTGNLPGDDTGFIQIGRDGTGTVEIRSGGQIINSANGITFIARKPGSEGTLIVDGAGSQFAGGAVVHVGSDFDFVNFQAISPGGDGTVAQSNGGQILGEIVIGQLAADDSAIGQVASAASTNALLSATGDGILDTGDGSYDTGGELEEAPGLEEAAANEGESEDSSSNSMGQCGA